ncbi:MAG TPA: hypothetical protein VD927_18905 [Chryseosolibacter sp.]|nr:hypothetical protein [Chryseosolibacter sp.]
MRYRTNSDNIYQEGTRITAKENPSLILTISNYYQRIYYCTVVAGKNNKTLPYFEHELISPGKSGDANAN